MRGVLMLLALSLGWDLAPDVPVAYAQPPDAPACPTCTWVPDLAIRPLPRGAVRVDDFGAAGDGVTPDDDAIRAAALAAGDGGTVLFTVRKVYVACAPLVPRKGQTWSRTGAGRTTLRRCDGLDVPLTADLEAGATRVPVADPGAFQPGQWVSVVSADGRARPDGDPRLHVVVAVDATSVTVTNELDRGFHAGDSLVTSFPLIRIEHDDVVLDELDLDGNREGNTRYAAWDIHQNVMVHNHAARTRITGCALRGAQGDAIGLIHARDTVIADSLFEDLNGSGVHLSSATSPQVLRSVFRRTNLDAERVRHAEAAITWSLFNTDVVVQDSCVQDVPARAFGDIQVHGGNRGVALLDNRVCRTEGFFAVKAKESLDLDLQVRGNLAVDVGPSSVAGYLDGDGSVRGVQITGNTIVNGSLVTVDVAHGRIADNVFVMRDPARFGPPEAGLITVWRGVDVEVRGNELRGGPLGLWLVNLDGPSRGVEVAGNVLRDQTQAAIVVGSAAYQRLPDHWHTRLQGIAVHDNVATSEVVAEGGALVVAGPRAVLRHNCVRSNQSALRLWGGDAATDTAMGTYTGNRLSGAEGAVSVDDAFVYGLTFSDNVTNTPLPAALAAAIGSADNPVDPAVRCD